MDRSGGVTCTASIVVVVWARQLDLLLNLQFVGEEKDSCLLQEQLCESAGIDLDFSF